MIDAAIEEHAKNFIKKYDCNTESNQLYRLDLSIYSCTLLDFILDLNFSPDRLSNIEQELLDASSYLGLTLYKFWKKIDSTFQISLTLSEYPQKEVKLAVKGIDLEHPETSTIRLTSCLNSIYIKKNIPLTSLRGENIHSALKIRPANQVVMGISLFYSSFFEGPLKDTSEHKLTSIFHKAFQILSFEIENKIILNNPILENLNISEIINPALVGPPMGYKEKFLGERTIRLISNSFTREEFPKDQYSTFARALLKMPDPHLCSVGYTLSASFNAEKSLSELGEFSLNFPLLSCALRPMYQYLRKKDLRLSWEDFIAKEDYKNAYKELDVELGSGLLPLIHPLRMEHILNPAHIAFYGLLSIGAIKEAIEHGKTLIMTKNESNSTLLLNLVLNQLLLGQIDEAKLSLIQLEDSFKSGPSQSNILDICRYLINSEQGIESKIREHAYLTSNNPDLWKLNNLYTNKYLQNCFNLKISVNSELIPLTEEDGLSSSIEFFNYLLFKSSIRNAGIRYSASPHTYWLTRYKLHSDL